jgi:hypothetical protein
VTDREEAGLRGRVRICSAERDYVYPDRRWVMYTTDTFSPHGNLLERLHRNPDGSHWSTICRYDERELMIEKEQATKEPKAHQLFSYRYDPLGRLDRIILHSAQEGERVFESVQYGADGTKTKTSYPTPLDDMQRRTISVFAESMLHVSIDAVIIMTVLDASDRAIRKVLYDSDDRVIRRIAFRYDARGLLLEEGELVGGSIRDDFRNVYRYDALGRQIEADRRWGDMGGGRRSFAYNDCGDVVQEVIEQNMGLMQEDIGVQSWTERFAYQYDDYGNWIGRTTETIVHTGGSRVSMIERRELTYY